MSLISEEHEARDAVLKVITETYGDATVTILDHRCAEAVLVLLRERGWVSPQEFALLTLFGVRDSAVDPDTQMKTVALSITDKEVLSYDGKPPAVVTRWREPAKFLSRIVIEQRQ
ncbi:MAG: hypothetical protein ACJ780_31535 [Solirubrobacteraceae bacterium]